MVTLVERVLEAGNGVGVATFLRATFVSLYSCLRGIQLDIRHNTLNFLSAKVADIQSFKIQCSCRTTLSKH